MEKAVNKLIAIAVLLSLSGNGFTQELPPLERSVTLELESTTIKETLKMMESQTGYAFAYRTDIIDGDKQLTRIYSSKTTRAVLDDLFSGSISYKERGNYIILRTQPVVSEKELKLSGYITDKKTGETIPYVTIYDSTTLSSASSNAYGYYNLSLKNVAAPVVMFRKQGYRDTTIQWKETGTAVFNISLSSFPPAIDSVSLEVEDEEAAKFDWFKRFIPSDEQKSKFKNFKEQFQRKIQLSLFPYVGTNGKLSGKTTVDYSFNVFGGFNGGVRVMEIGTIFNLVWDSVSYFQAAGIFNKVGGYQQGAQFAGITNINNEDVLGAQFAGITNVTNGSITGAQFAGIGNFVGKDSKGAQFAGIFNRSKGALRGAQFAGIANSVTGITGAQFAGIGNYSSLPCSGPQVAGIFNKSTVKIVGAQVAGIINIADSVKGTQLGLININKSIDGVPVGFLSYSKSGLHQLELSTNEVFHLNLAFKTGVDRFYNSFIGGVRFAGNDPYFGLGYGVGTSVKTSNKARLFFDFQAINIQRASSGFRPNGLGKFTLSYHWQLSPVFAIAAGPSLNFLVAEQVSGSGTDFNSLAPYSINTTSDGAYKVQQWFGGHIALRFF